jgi:hypothetical protein
VNLGATGSLAVALIVHDGDSLMISQSTRILMVVRDPRTNATHPNVVSVPTGRIPMELLTTLWPASRASARFGWTELTEPVPRSSARGSGDPVVHVVGAILARKLGLGEALESESVRFEAAVVAATVGRSHYGPDHVPREEDLTMIALVVVLESGQDGLPRRTASYSETLWVPAGELLAAVDSRDPSRLGLDPVDLCIHGLCVATAYDVVAASLGYSPYARPEATLIGSNEVRPVS